MLAFDEYAAVRKRAMNRSSTTGDNSPPFNGNGNTTSLSASSPMQEKENLNQLQSSKKGGNGMTWNLNLNLGKSATLGQQQRQKEEEEEEEERNIKMKMKDSSHSNKIGMEEKTVHNKNDKETDVSEGNDSVKGRKAVNEFTPLGSISVLKQIGYLLETSECQGVLLLLVYMDMIARFTMDYLNADKKIMMFLMNSSSTDLAKNQSVILNEAYDGFFFLLNTFSAFCTAVLACELAMLMMCFGRKFFFHIGYMFDTILLILFVLNENTSNSSFSRSAFNSSEFLQEQAKFALQESAKDSTNWSWKILSMILNTAHSLCHLPKEIHLLAFLKCWRLLRLFTTLINNVKADHQLTKTELLQSEQKISEMELDISRKDDAINREIDGRKRLMQTLQGYKDEVDTLNEALRIAAMDVAMVAEEEDEEDDLDLDMDSDLEEDDDESDLGSEEDEDAEEDDINLGEESDENNLYGLELQADAKGQERKGQQNTGKEGNPIKSNNRIRNAEVKGAFYVNEDGSFNYK